MTNNHYDKFIYKDRFTGYNPHSIVLGVPNSGVNLVVKSDILYVKSNDDTEAIVLDPFGDFDCLLPDANKKKINLSHLLNVAADDDDEYNYRLLQKIDFVISLLDHFHNEPLGAKEKAFVSACIRGNQNLRSLNDLEAVFSNIDTESEMLPTRITQLVQYKDFLNQLEYITVKRDRKLTVINFETVDNKNATYAILLKYCADQIMRRRRNPTRTVLYLPDFDLLLWRGGELLRNYIKCSRKWGCGVNLSTTNVEDLWMTGMARHILNNISHITMLNQTENNAKILQDIFGFSDACRKHVTTPLYGGGLIFNGRETRAVPPPIC